MASTSASYLKITECLVAGNLKPALLQPHRNLAIGTVDVTNKIAHLEEREAQVEELLKAVQVAVDAERNKPVGEDEDPKERVTVCEETAQLNTTAQNDLAAVERALQESKAVNYDNGNKFRDRMKVLDTELETVMGSAKSASNLASVPESDLRKLFLLEPKPRGKAIQALVEKLDPQDVLGLKTALTDFIERNMPEVQKIITAKMELITDQTKRFTRIESAVKKLDENMDDVDNSVDVLARKINKELTSVVKAVPQLEARIQHNRPQMS